MPKGYRDILDPSDPYWPRVRRLHFYLWAKGTLAAKNRAVIGVSFLWLLVSTFGTFFSLAWRSVLLLGALFLIDWIAPGKVSCVFRETVGYEKALSALSLCTVFDVPYLPLISLAVLFMMVLALIYPIRRFLEKVFEVIFMSLNIIAVGYPLKFVAYLASQEPAVAGKLFDKSYIFGPLSTAMTDIFPSDYKRDLDQLWDVYRRSQSPAYEQDLEGLLENFEAMYMRHQETEMPADLSAMLSEIDDVEDRREAERIARLLANAKTPDEQEIVRREVTAYVLHSGKNDESPGERRFSLPKLSHGLTIEEKLTELLENNNISADTKKSLREFLSDLRAGRLQSDDDQYIHALYDHLMKPT